MWSKIIDFVEDRRHMGFRRLFNLWAVVYFKLVINLAIVKLCQDNKLLLILSTISLLLTVTEYIAISEREKAYKMMSFNR